MLNQAAISAISCLQHPCLPTLDHVPDPKTGHGIHNPLLNPDCSKLSYDAQETCWELWCWWDLPPWQESLQPRPKAQSALQSTKSPTPLQRCDREKWASSCLSACACGRGQRGVHAACSTRSLCWSVLWARLVCDVCSSAGGTIICIRSAELLNAALAELTSDAGNAIQSSPWLL